MALAAGTGASGAVAVASCEGTGNTATPAKPPMPPKVPRLRRLSLESLDFRLIRNNAAPPAVPVPSAASPTTQLQAARDARRMLSPLLSASGKPSPVLDSSAPSRGAASPLLVPGSPFFSVSTPVSPPRAKSIVSAVPADYTGSTAVVRYRRYGPAVVVHGRPRLVQYCHIYVMQVADLHKHAKPPTTPSRRTVQTSYTTLRVFGRRVIRYRKLLTWHAPYVARPSMASPTGNGRRRRAGSVTSTPVLRSTPSGAALVTHDELDASPLPAARCPSPPPLTL